MKRTEAIAWLEVMKEDAIFEQCDALKMAIDALQAKQKGEPKFYDGDDFWDDRVSIHDRLINASWVINEIHKNICDMCEQGIDIEDCNDCKIEKIKRIIYSAPTPSIEAVQGEWIRVGHDIYECSLCHQNVMTKDIDCYSYCHRCGAKMGKGGEDE
jgi:hypothetical protein